MVKSLGQSIFIDSSGNTTVNLNGTIIKKDPSGGIVASDASNNTLDSTFNNIDVSGNATINGNVGIGKTTIGVALDVSGNINTSGDLVVSGNITVNGTTTTINSTTVTVQDPIITLGSDVSNNKDKGIEFKYGTSKIGFFGYDDSTGNLTFLKDASNNSEVFTGTQGTIEGSTFNSTVVSGTAPLTVTSSTLVTNLNADLLDGLDNNKFMRTDIDSSTTGYITGKYFTSTVTTAGPPLVVASSLKVNNLNADLLDGLDSTKFMRTDANTSTTGNIGIGTNNPLTKLHVNDTGAMIIPAGTTAQLPSTPVLGMVRFNIDTNRLQFYNVSGWNSIGGVNATGGTMTEIAGYRVHTFTSSGTFTVIGGGEIDVLVIAGGGGGGGDNGGGGGAGGLIFKPSHTLVSSGYNVVIGNGGAVDVNQGGTQTNGGNSTFSNLTAIGGGCGATGQGGLKQAANGGSGGGQDGERAIADRIASSGTQPQQSDDSGVFGYGRAGGLGANPAGGGGGGGGGAGIVGGNATTIGGLGGDGLSQVNVGGIIYNFAEIFGTSNGQIITNQAWFAGGGAGGNENGTNTSRSGGAGGGGSTSGFNGGNGLANTGGGGSGSTYTGSVTPNSGQGGSGIVIIRYRI